MTNWKLKNKVRNALRRASIFYRQGQLKKAGLELERAIIVAQKINLKNEAIEAMDLLGDVYRKLGESQKSVAVLQKALGMARHDQRKVADLKRKLGFLYFQLHEDVSKAEDFALESLKGARAHGLKKVEANAMALMGHICETKDEFEKALGWFYDALVLTRKANYKEREITVISDIGRISAIRGFYPEALKHLNKALEIARKAEFNLLVLVNLSRLGDVYLALGDSNRALEHYKEALRLANKFRLVTEIYETNFRIGNYFLTQKDFPSAKKYLIQAYKTANNLNYLRHKLYCLLAIAQLYFEMNDPEKSLRYFWKVFKYIAKNYNKYLRVFLKMVEGMAAAFQRLDQPRTRKLVEKAERIKGFAKEKGIYQSLFESLEFQGLVSEIVQELEAIRKLRKGYLIRRGLKLNLTTGEFHRNGEKGYLRSTELRIFNAILQSGEEPYSKQQIVKEVLDVAGSETRSPYTHIHRMRKKLGKKLIVTIRKKGYMISQLKI